MSATNSKKRTIEMYLGSVKKEVEEETTTIVKLNTNNIEFLSSDSAEAQKILKISNGVSDNNITYLMDDDGNYYFHTSDGGEDFQEIEQEVLQIKSEPETSAVPTNNSSILEKVKFNLSKAKTERNKTSKKTDEIDDTLADPDLDEIYEFNENDEDTTNNQNNPDQKLPSHAICLEPITNIVKTKLLHCTHCPYSTAKKFLYSRHLKTHTNERPFKCSVCERGFTSNASLLNHVNTHLGKKPYACKECTSSFTTAGELVRHTRYKHTGEKPHKCTECDYASVELSKLRRHIRCHTGERPYQCPHCTYASPDTFKLKRHMRTHTGEKPYECDICQARFTQSNSLKAHRLIHSVSDKPVYQCSLCPTTCGRKTDLRLHVLKIHNSDKPIKCKRCGKELADRYSYKLHIKTHQGEKCYRCKLCPYAAVLMRHLETHMLIHTDEKPFFCEICSQKFRQRQLLKRHINLYHNKNYVPPVPRAKEHACPHCKRTFAHKGNLMRHMEMHDPRSNTENEKLKLKIGRMTRLERNSTLSTKSTNFVQMNDESFDDPEYDDNYDGSEENYELIETNDDDVDNDDQKVDYDDIKPSKIDLRQLDNSTNPEVGVAVKTINIKKEADGKEYIAVAADDGEEYMVLEVTQSDDEVDDIDNEQDDNNYNVIEPVEDEDEQYETSDAIDNVVTITKVSNSLASTKHKTTTKIIKTENIIEVEGLYKRQALQFLEIVEVAE